MLSQVRRKVERAEEALAFARTNPFEGPGPEGMVRRLDTLVGRAKELVRLQVERDQARAEWVIRKDEVRERLAVGLLRLFSNAGQAAAKANPALTGRFTPVQNSRSALAFVTSAGILIAAMRTNLEAVAASGVDAAMIDEAEALLREYEAMAAQASEAKTRRIHARAELFPVSAEIMNLIRRLDGLNRHRFAADPARLAAWKSALRSPGPVNPRGKEVAPGTDEVSASKRVDDHAA